MPSYLSSVQTSGPEPADDLGRVLGRRRQHEAERMEEAKAGVIEPVVEGEERGLAEIAGEHDGAGHRGRQARPNARAIAASTSPSRRPIRSSPPRILTTYVAVSGSQRRRRASKTRGLRGGAAGGLDRGEGGGDVGNGRGLRPPGGRVAGGPVSRPRGRTVSVPPASTSPTACPRSE